ncbi:unnamed protein product, partial [Rotaria sp. Silwood1]
QVPVLLFALAQLIDDIDFRILTYLEQQLKQQYPDIRVRQATASTFAKYVFCRDNNYVAFFEFG